MNRANFLMRRLEHWVNNRTVISVQEQEPDKRSSTFRFAEVPVIYGWVVELSCGHRYWTPVNVAQVGDRRRCAECMGHFERIEAPAKVKAQGGGE
jgi:hypothetical protein